MTHSLEGALTVRAQSSCCEPIAIIGIGCRFPGGINSPEQFWHVLRDGVDTIGKVPQCRWDARCEPYKELIPNYGGFIDEVDQFDASFFRNFINFYN